MNLVLFRFFILFSVKASQRDADDVKTYSSRYLDSSPSRFASKEPVSIAPPSQIASNDISLMAPTYRFVSKETPMQARSNNYSSNELPLPILSNGYSSNELPVPSRSNGFSSNECSMLSPLNGYSSNESSMLATSIGGSPYKRRRETEVENPKVFEDDNPFTKRNFERQNSGKKLPEASEVKVI